MSAHLESYLRKVEQSSPGITPSLKSTIDALVPKHIKSFSFREHITGLLLGNVQSGKTSHVFGLIAAAADEDFSIFIFLTTDNVYLHDQTYKRALKAFDTFTVCSEDEDVKFMESKLRKPLIVVIKKNNRVLKRWKDNLSSSKYCEGRPIFIVDDEGDAASLNTRINQRQQSTINRHLDGMKRLANSSVYLQVTATPQALLLQSKHSGWKPSFVHYFLPGSGYLGGDYFYADPPSSCIRITPENELDELKNEDGLIPDGIRRSLVEFLVTGAHILLSKSRSACNFLVHPSVRIADHNRMASRLGEYLNEMLESISENRMGDYLEESWADLKKTKNDLVAFDQIHSFLKQTLGEGRIKIFIMNSIGSNVVDCSSGMNIIVGGNSLGRGVTFPALQTVLYCRTAKMPQADTFWQHCRMFGYDRDPDLMRLFIPASLLKLFIELNSGNKALLGQIIGTSLGDIGLLYPPGIRPTRPNVVDKELVDVIVGGVNYFPGEPKISHVTAVDKMLSKYTEEGGHEITLNGVISLLEYFDSQSKADWSSSAFINCLKALKASHSNSRAFLIIRRNRSIAKGTGTLLSPMDRSLGDSVKDAPVLTLYRVNGELEKGWEGNPFWIPNIKLPEGKNFHKVI